MKFKSCTEACTKLNVSCPNKDCRNWIDYEKDLNCTLITIDNTYLTIDENKSYIPIMLTPSQSLPEVRSNSKFAFKIDAFDPQQDEIVFSTGNQLESGFDVSGDKNTLCSFFTK